MSQIQPDNWWRKALAVLMGKKPQPPVADQPQEEETEQCCAGLVNIAYRGIADGRLYMAHGRKWREVRFFRPNGLRVFCADCRRRLF